MEGTTNFFIMVAKLHLLRRKPAYPSNTELQFSGD